MAFFELINLKQIATATMVLFAVIDIIGSIPIIINLRQKVGHIESEKASSVALLIGDQILALIGIDVYSFAVAGSILIFFIAIEMILGITLYKDEEPETASIVPIAFPLIAGAGTMTTLMSMRAAYADINIIVAIIINVGLVYVVLKLSGKIGAWLGKGGIGIIRKIFGIILMAIAVKLFTGNIQHLF
jgi:multiple antibiotic resistance protein